MRDSKAIAATAARAIHDAIIRRREVGQQVDAVFIGTDLRYILAAMPDSPLKYSMDRGELIYGAKVIRYMTDDLTQFFLACSYPTVPGEPVNPVHRPYLKTYEEEK